jgi:hypothetical protein
MTGNQMKNVIFVLIAIVFWGCSKDKDTSEFEQIIIGCWDIVESESDDYYYCFDKDNISLLKLEYVVGSGSYIVYSDKNNIYVSFEKDKNGVSNLWTIKYYDQNSFTYYNKMMDAPKDVYSQCTRRIDN